MTRAMAQLDPALPPSDVLAGVDRDVRDLVAANRELYRGHWDDFAEDLRRRQAGRPYLFTTGMRPDLALAWIERLKAYEAARGELLSVPAATAASTT